jgi:serine/threonine-protein kinase
MSPAPANSDLPAGRNGQTATAASPAPPGSQVRTRRCVGFVPGSSTYLADEVHELLRRRLRTGGLIACLGFAAFFIKSFLFVDPNFDIQDRLFLGLVVLVQGTTVGLLFSRLCFSMRWLRALELVVFGVMTVFFAYLQIRMFGHGAVLDWAAEDPINKERIVGLAAATNSLRWFVLLVLYGTFIPNTWQRCSAVIGTIASVPLVLTLMSCTLCPFMSEFWSTLLFNMLVILAIGASIAIFGSYRIAELQQKAYEARRLGQYVLKQKLGSGGMGEVYLGEHTLLRRKCAIKLIRPEFAGDPTNRRRFEREVQAMANLTHWNSVEVYDYGNAEDGTFYYVMEYLPGLTLDELVRRFGPLEPARAVWFLRQICGALREAHSIGLIHRDIKPSNVIVCRRGGMDDVAKLLDFGLVQDLGLGDRVDRLTVQGAVLGSPPFISPEQTLNKASVDGRTDIYSLGGLGYFLLTGQAPFVRETIMELLMAHVHDDVVPPRKLRAEIPDDLEGILLRCLEKKPEDRFADIVKLEHALARCSVADDWNAERAEEWWREHKETSASVSSDDQETVISPDAMLSAR